MRFPEFKGEWEECQLGKIADITKGNGISKEQLSDEGNACILYGELYTKYKSEIITEVYSKTTLDPSLLVRSQENDVIIPCSGETAIDISTARCVPYNNILLGGDLNIIRLKSQNGGFLAYQLNGVRKYDIARIAQGVSVVHLYGENLKRIRVYYPSIKEQQKITFLLSLLDSRIAIQIKIIKKYESLIKGLSNKVFSRDIRFKTNNGNNFPNWKTKSFEHIGQPFSGLSGKAKEDFGIGKPYIQYKQVFDSPKIQIQNCGLVNVSNSEKQNNVKYGDILFTISSETPGEIGMSSVLLDEVDEMYLNSFCFGYRLSSFEVLNPLYASYLFRDSSFRNKIVKIAQGSTRYNISKSELLKLEISLPCIEEQVLIASFLSAVDEKIKIVKEVLNLYLKQKNYLLRQMFI